MAETFDVVATRDIPAPPDSAWKSWTDEDYVKKWWGPHGFTCPVADLDVRVGGRSLVCMSAPDWGFPALYSTWAYTLVDAPRRLEFVHNMADADGNTLDMPDIPHDVHHVVTFEPVSDGVTRLTVHESTYPTEEQRDRSKQGLEECLDKLVAIYPWRVLLVAPLARLAPPLGGRLSGGAPVVVEASLEDKTRP